MTVREYIGARYVPLFIGEWDDTVAYEPLSIVTNQGNAYTSRQYVPVGVEITNTQYWARTGNYNAQVEAYRQEVEQYREEVETFDGRITENAEAIEDEETARIAAVQAEETARIAAVQAEETARIADVNAEETARIADIAQVENEIATETTPKKTILFFGDSWGSTDAPSLAARDNGVSYISRIKFMKNDVAYNFCDGGAGFADTSSNVYNTNFAGQVAIAASDDRFENADVTDVICFGGLNDVGTGYTNEQIRTGAIDFINAARNSFQNARIVIIGCNIRQYGAAAFYNGLLSATKTLSKVVTEYACEFYPSLTWLLCDATCWSTDNYHPNNHGGYILAAFVGGIIYGKTPSYLVNIPLNAMADGNTSLTYTERADSTGLMLDMFSGVISGNWDVDLTDYSASSGAHLVAMKSDTNSPFVYGDVPVGGYHHFSGQIPQVSGKFTGQQAGNASSNAILYLYWAPVSGQTATLARLMLSVGGRVF